MISLRAPLRHGSGQVGRLVRFRGGWFCAVSPHGDKSPVLLVRERRNEMRDV